MKIVIDVSRYQKYEPQYNQGISPDQWDLLSTCVSGVIARTSFGITKDTAFEEHRDNAVARNMKVIGYHWVDPTWNLITQVNYLDYVCGETKVGAVYLDMEQYWKDWDAYMKQDLATAYATRFTADELNRYYSKFLTLFESISDIKVGTYSAEWFFNSYSPDMKSWIYDTNYWEAKYARYYNKKELSEFYANRRPVMIDDVYGFAEKMLVGGRPRQFESYLEVDGLKENLGYHLDWNAFSDRDFCYMFNVKPETEVHHDEQEADMAKSVVMGFKKTAHAI